MHEYEQVKKILYVEIPMALIITLFVYFILYQHPLYNFRPAEWEIARAKFPLEFYPYVFFNNLQYFLFYSVIGGMIWLAVNASRKDFRYLLAREYFERASYETQIQNIHYLLGSIRSYNKYLSRNLELQINDINIIFSKILFGSNIDKANIINTLSNAFKIEDRLEPIKRLLEILEVQDKEHFLVEVTIRQKIKDILSYILATIISGVISLVQLYQYLFPTNP